MAIWISGLISGQYCYYFYYYFIIISLFFCYYFNIIFIVIFYYFFYIGLISNNIVNTQRDSLFMGHCTSDQLLEY